MTHSGCLPNPRAQVDLPVNKGVSAAERELAFKPYSLHILTNCQWSLNKEIENCTKPWDFVGYSLESNLLGYDDEGHGNGEDDDGEDDDGEDDDEKNKSRKDDQPSRSLPLFLKRNAVNGPGSDEDHEKNARKLRDNRDAFSKVHLTGCVFVGLSFLCTAISFFFLPALGQWISVGNLALATLSTIFLFTSSIFTAVMANKIRSVMENGEGFSGIAAETGKTFGALV